MRFQKGNPSRLTPVKPRMERFSVPEPNSGCYLWLGALSTDGYAQISHNGRNRNAHIIAYELAKGPVPDGLQIDHLCRIRCCVNPDHLEAVTSQINNIRGLAPMAVRERNAQNYSPTCPYGHTDIVRSVRKDGRLQKECRTCRNERRRLKCQTVGEVGHMMEPPHPDQL